MLDSDGVTTLRDVDMGYTTRDNLTSVTDQLDALRDENFTFSVRFSVREMLASASGPYDDISYTYDGVSNRLTRAVDDGTLATDTCSYPATNSRLTSIDQNGAFTRTMTYDNAGNTLVDTRDDGVCTYTYNAANRTDSVSETGSVYSEYVYNAQGQQVIRTLFGASPRSRSTLCMTWMATGLRSTNTTAPPIPAPCCARTPGYTAPQSR